MNDKNVEDALIFLNSTLLKGYEVYRDLGPDGYDDDEMIRIVNDMKKVEKDKQGIDDLDSI